MIKNEGQYRCDAEFDRWETLRRMTPEESIALGEALLTSEIMRVAEFPDDDRPQSLAIALGVRPEAARTSRAHHDVPERV
ncbi:MAG: hypothetical protein ACKORK_04435 [Gemmatimonadota bacterium]